MTQIDRLQGLWRRSLIEWADGRRDVETAVDWLQGPTFYADLRQPRLPPMKAPCLRLLPMEDVVALARQEGFAGILLRHPDCFEWTRLIDYQPPGPFSDRGTLVDKGTVMIETGFDLPYVEHWHRDAGMPSIRAAVRLLDRADGREAILVRAGDVFMLARNRHPLLADHVHLSDAVRAAPSLAAAQDLIDCELSIGAAKDTWRITRSSLPWRVGMALDPRLVGPDLLTRDVSEEGTAIERRWAIVQQDGAIAELL
jgi:hypothetical protein